MCLGWLLRSFFLFLVDIKNLRALNLMAALLQSERNLQMWNMCFTLSILSVFLFFIYFIFPQFSMKTVGWSRKVGLKVFFTTYLMWFSSWLNKAHKKSIMIFSFILSVGGEARTHDFVVSLRANCLTKLHSSSYTNVKKKYKSDSRFNEKKLLYCHFDF